MSFALSIKRAVHMFKLDEKAIQQISREKKAGWYGIIIILLAGIFLGLSLYFLDPGIGSLVILGGPILLLLTSFIGISVLYIFARLLGGKGSFHDYYRAYSHMYVFNWIAVIPVIGPFLSSLAGVWQIIMGIYVTKVTMKLKLSKAAIVVLVPTMLLLILAVFTTIALVLTIFLQYFLTLVQPGHTGGAI